MPRAPACRRIGCIISRNGTVVTTDHAGAGAARIIVTFHHVERFPAKGAAADGRADITIIKITSPQRVNPLRRRHCAASARGDRQSAAGNPCAPGYSLAVSFISARGGHIGVAPSGQFSLRDPPINLANSSGPDIQLAGQAIGIDSAIVSPSGGPVGSCLAIPRNAARGGVPALSTRAAIAAPTLAYPPAGALRRAQPAGTTGIKPGRPASKTGSAQSSVVPAAVGEVVSSAAGQTRYIASAAPEIKVVLGVSKNEHIFALPVIVDRRPVQLGD